jgi:Family of unknown function (DUF6308)
MELVFGAGKLDRRVPEAEVFLRDWREKEKDYGQLYLEFEPVTPRDRVLVEDLAATMLINSRVAAPAATSVYRNGAAVDLRSLPEKALEETSDGERQRVADVIGTMTSWPWVGASLATKTLHKKRPALIPILDNQAIFGAYMNPLWPEKPSLTETIKAVPRIKEALDWIAYDLARPENELVWPELQAIEPERSRIELFDMVWWMYFRQVEPVAPAANASKSAASPSPAPTTTQNGDVLIFRGDDAAYLRWISEHPRGYVVNAERNPRPSYLKLHRATCTWLSGRGETGAYTERQYIKICSTSLDALGAWARAEVGSTPESRCACM